MQIEPPSVMQPSAKAPVHWPSVLQFGMGIAAAGILFTGAIGLVVTGLFSAAAGALPAETLSVLLMAASFSGIGLLMVPSIYYGLMRLMGRPAINSKAVLNRLRPRIWLLLFVPVLLVGAAAAQVAALSWLVLPALHLLAIGLPIGWMVYVAGRGLPWGTSQRIWGVFNSGLALGPFLISILEFMAVAAVALGAGVYIAARPELVEVVMDFAQSMQNNPPTPEALLDQLGPYMLTPGVVFVVLLVSAGLVPLIEEALKPIGVWLLVGRPLSPAAGFAAGALSGAGFALTESLLLSSGGSEWPLLVLVRMGTGAIHILTSGLTGWALATAWKQRRFGTLGLSYLTSVIIHALWNGLTVTTVFSGLAQSMDRSDALPLVNNLAVAAVPTLVLLTTGSLFLLAFFNYLLRQRLAARNPVSPP